MSRKKDKVKGIVFGKKRENCTIRQQMQRDMLYVLQDLAWVRRVVYLYLHYNTGTERVMSLIFQEIYARM